jgi:hypothetical protein
VSAPRKSDDALVLALACGLSAEQAARQAGVSAATAHRRLREPAFKCRVDDLRRETLARAAAMLTAAAVESARTLADLLKPSYGPSVRLQAARSVLEHGVKLRSLVEVEERLGDLEERAKDVKERGGDHSARPDFRPTAERGD